MHKFNTSLSIPVPNWATHSLVFSSGNPDLPGLNGVYIAENMYQYYGGVVDYVLDEEVNITDDGWDVERWVNEIKDNGPYTLTDLRAVEENE
jgi:hypothetical protein